MTCSQPKHDYYETLGVRADGLGGRYPQGLPEARAQVSSGSESGRQIRRRPLQERPGSLRHPERFEEAADVRSVRLLLGERIRRAGAGRRRPAPQTSSPTWISVASIFPTRSAARQAERRSAAAGRRRDGTAADSAISSANSSTAAARLSRRPQPEKGTDLEYVLNIDFWQAIRGTQARSNITRYDSCPTCHGTGATDAGDVDLPAMQRHRQGDRRWPAP